MSIPGTIDGLTVTSIGDAAFYGCTSLTGVYFKGNVPGGGLNLLFDASSATVYFLPGTTGWDTLFAGFPVVMWDPKVLAGDASFGMRTNRFGFNITGSPDMLVVVETCSNLTARVWISLQTNTLAAGSCYFSDPQSALYQKRFYRLRMP